MASEIFRPLLILIIVAMSSNICEAQDPSVLSLEYYKTSCPAVEKIVRGEMELAVGANARNAATILRLHFHDCFVQGCDGSVLLDDTVAIKGEKGAKPNVNSLRGFDLVDQIKNKLEFKCPGVVSCADLLAIAARDAVVLVGGPYWDVPVGRLDSKTASIDLANTDIPQPNQGLVTLISKFIAKGLSPTDMVALVGSHTIGVARCVNFRDRIYGDFETTSANDLVSTAYLSQLKANCPQSQEGDDNINPMDYVTPAIFDNSFFEILLRGDGLLNSDQEMYSSDLTGFVTANLVKEYAGDPLAFFKQFSDSMVKMGNLTNLEGGEVRKTCRLVNA